MNRALLLLALCQGFFLTNNVVFIAINGLVGLQLAPTAWMATLPLTAYVAGGALSTGLVAPKKRIATKPSYGSKLRRLDDKRGRAEIKRGRSTKGVME